MPLITGGVKLKRGDVTRIATRRNLKVSHVAAVARGERKGASELVRDLRDAARRHAQAEARRHPQEPVVDDDSVQTAA